MRFDGRRADQLRQVQVTPDFTRYAEGSVLIAMGNTQVLCNVTVEDGVPRWKQVQGRSGGWITGEYAMLPRATNQRTQRETHGLSGRTQEIRRLIGRSLRAAVDLDKVGQRTITVDCDVLQADGGTRTASITGSFIALALALHRLESKRLIEPGALLSPVAAISVGVVKGEPLLDLCYEEDSNAEVDANVVMNAQGHYIEVQSTAEGRPFSRAALDQLLLLADGGIQELFAIQQEVIRTATKR